MTREPPKNLNVAEKIVATLGTSDVVTLPVSGRYSRKLLICGLRHLVDRHGVRMRTQLSDDSTAVHFWAETRETA